MLHDKTGKEREHARKKDIIPDNSETLKIKVYESKNNRVKATEYCLGLPLLFVKLEII